MESFSAYCAFYPLDRGLCLSVKLLQTQVLFSSSLRSRVRASCSAASLRRAAFTRQ